MCSCILYTIDTFIGCCLKNYINIYNIITDNCCKWYEVDGFESEECIPFYVKDKALQKYGVYQTDEFEGKGGRKLPTVQDLRSSYVEAGNTVPAGYQKWWSKTFRQVMNENEV